MGFYEGIEINSRIDVNEAAVGYTNYSVRRVILKSWRDSFLRQDLISLSYFHI